MDVVISAETARSAATQLSKLPYRKVAGLIQALVAAPSVPTAPAPERPAKSEPADRELN